MADPGAPSPDRRFRRLCLAGIVAGVLLRIATMGTFAPEYDAYLYAQDADEGLVTLWAGLPHGNLPRTPLFSSIAWGFAQLAGDPERGLELASLAASVGAVAIVFFTTRDLFGSRTAYASALVVALDPGLLLLTGYRYSENLALAFFALTLWAIFRSLRQPPYIIAAGAFAAAAYLARSSLGPFFFIAASLGLLWRLKYGRRPGQHALAAINQYYVTGALTFLAIVGAWALHNWTLTGRFTSNVTVSKATAAALAEPWTYAGAFLVKLVFLTVLWLAYAFFFGPRLLDSLRRARSDEAESALWVAVASIVLTGAAMSAGFYLIEENPLLWLDNFRYVTLGVVPLTWIVFRDPKPVAPFRGAFYVVAALVAVSWMYASRAYTAGVGAFQALVGLRRVPAFVALSTGLAVLSMATVLLLGAVTTHPGRVDALRSVEAAAEPGDVLTIRSDPDGTAGRALVIRPEMATFYAPTVRPEWSDNLTGDWILSYARLDAPSYRLHSQHRDAEGARGAVLDAFQALDLRNAPVYVYARVDA